MHCPQARAELVQAAGNQPSPEPPRLFDFAWSGEYPPRQASQLALLDDGFGTYCRRCQLRNREGLGPDDVVRKFMTLKGSNKGRSTFAGANWMGGGSDRNPSSEASGSRFGSASKD